MKRTATKSRRRPSARPKGRLMDKNTAVYHNPMVHARQPKIADGSAVESLGRQHRDVIGVTTPSNKTCYAFMIPSLSCPLMVVSVLGQDTEGASRYPGANDGPKNFTVPFDAVQELAADFTCPSGGATTAFDFRMGLKEKEILKWRMVSSGCKVSNLNAGDDDGGFFETRHFGVRLDDENFCLQSSSKSQTDVSEQGKAAAHDNMFTLSPSGMLSIINQFDANDASYFGTRLRDISKYQFHLGESRTENVWCVPKGDYNLTGKCPTDAGSGRGWLEFHNGTSGRDNLRFIEDQLDMNYVVTVIKITGNSTGDTKLMFESCSNYEIQYTEGSNMQELSTHSAKNPDHVRHRELRRKSHANAAFRVMN
jgi:hypothetical protein